MRLCQVDHPMTMFTEDDCPFCELRRERDTFKADQERLALVVVELRGQVDRLLEEKGSA